jgi:hypothetical protein
MKQIIYFGKKYDSYITSNPNDLFINNNRKIIGEILSKAGLENESFHQAVPIGYGKAYTGTFKLFDNISLKNEYTINRFKLLFPEAEAIFKKRICESFNPIYWIEFIIYLPKNIFSYIGLERESIYIKITQVFYWISSAIVPYFLIEYLKIFFPFK